MELFEDIELFDCPLCRGAGLIEVECGWCVYVTCMDCGCHTAEVPYNTPEEKIKAAQQAAHIWNIGKVLSSNPGE